MPITRETLKAIIRDYGGFELDDGELELIRPELVNYIAEMEKLRDVDLSDVMSSRLLRVREGGEP